MSCHHDPCNCFNHLIHVAADCVLQYCTRIRALPAPAPPLLLTDSHAPTWTNNLDGHVNLRDAVRRTIQYTGPNGKQYALRGDGKLATLLVR